MKSRDKTLTSVRIHPEMWKSFKKLIKQDGFTFQKLAERAIFFYLNDEGFRQKMRNKLSV